MESMLEQSKMEQEQSDLKYEAYMLAAVMMEEKYGSFKDPL